MRHTARCSALSTAGLPKTRFAPLSQVGVRQSGKAKMVRPVGYMGRFQDDYEEKLAQAFELWETAVKCMPLPAQLEAGGKATNCAHLRWLKLLAWQTRYPKIGGA